MSALTQSQLAEELAKRRVLRGSLLEWSRYRRAQVDQAPAEHHLLLLTLVQEVIDGNLIHPKTGDPCSNLIYLLPPGAAKSTYLSMDTPPWYLQRKPGSRILACSYAADLIESFSRDCRNCVQQESKTLGYRLAPDSKAVQEWSTTNGGTYRCAGVGAGISGRRGDLGYIDDFIGTEEDADSKLVRDKQWTWYNGDFWPRLKPEAIQIIIANRRHEEDLVGRLIEREEDSWVIVKIGFFPKENDPLGRIVVDKEASLGHIDFSNTSPETVARDEKAQVYLDSRLWPQYFTRLQAAKVLMLPARTQAGLYGQEPAPDDGNYFKKDWLIPYTRDELDQVMRQDNVRVYGAADWAVSEEKDANRTCFGGAIESADGVLYILPDIFWKTAGPKEVVQQFMAFLQRRKPLVTWSEKGHISKSWGPFLKDLMDEQRLYSYIEEVTPAKGKDVRARSIQARMSLGKVRFPTFASWWGDALHEMLMFPGGKTDDFVDFLAHLGMGLNKMVRASKPKVAQVIDETWKPTLKWLKEENLKRIHNQQPKYEGR